MAMYDCLDRGCRVSLAPPCGTLLLCLSSLVIGLAHADSAVAQDEADGTIDEVEMEVVDDPQADERDFAREIRPPGAEDLQATGGTAPPSRPRDARERAQQAGEAARDATPPGVDPAAGGEARPPDPDGGGAQPPKPDDGDTAPPDQRDGGDTPDQRR